MATAAATPAPALITYAYLGASPAVQSAEQSIVGGTWTGQFLQKDWTFEFRNEDGALRGRYLTSGGTNWQSLHEIVISGRSVSFNIKSKPKVSFSLEVDAPVRNMSGTVAIDGLATVPFSAARKP
ncbi:MAG: hypothetical protein WBR13_09485 [Allosphingosinicella sp.]